MQAVLVWCWALLRGHRLYIKDARSLSVNADAALRAIPPRSMGAPEIPGFNLLLFILKHEMLIFKKRSQVIMVPTVNFHRPK